MLSRFSLKKKLSIGISMVVLIILASGFLVYQIISTVESGWNDYQSRVAAREELINGIRSDFGYGAMIHNFKNYILRGDEKYQSSIGQNYQDLVRDINHYLALENVTEQEVQALKAIRTVADAYYDNTVIVTDLLSKGRTPQQIDSAVKIDDTPAVEGFRLIQSYYEQLTGESNLEITNRLTEATMMIFGGLSMSTLIILFAMYHTYRSVIPPLQELNTTMLNIAEGEGDLRLRLDDRKNDELGALAKAFNLFISRIESMIQEEKTVVKGLSDSAKQLNSISLDSNTSIEVQKSNTEQLSAALEEVSSTVGEVASSTAQASEAASTMATLSKQGVKSVVATREQIESISTHIDNAAQVIEEVSSASDNIGEMLNVISDIADQTNLLALNAAIEAARAGESGRGFAVVADEVRGLAQRTGDSLDEIQKTINRLQNGVTSAVAAMELGVDEAKQGTEIAYSASENINDIVNAIAGVEEMNLHISTAAEQQKVVIEEMNSNVHQISDMSAAVYDGSQEIVNQARNLSDTTKSLSDIVEGFKTA